MEYKINKIADIKKYRQKIPISLVDREDAYVWQYHMNLPVILVTKKDIQIKSKYHVHYFRSDKPFKKVRLRVEDFFLFLLNKEIPHSDNALPKRELIRVSNKNKLRLPAL